MKKTLLILLFAFACILLCCCGRTDGGGEKETAEAQITVDTPRQEYVYTPVRFRDYVHFTTNSDTALNKVFASYAELEAFVVDSGLLRDSVSSNTHSMNGLLNFFSHESFEENVVVLLIAQRGDTRYGGYVSRVSGGKESIEIVFDCKEGDTVEVEDHYSLSVALVIPKEHCDADTEFVFAFENAEETVIEADTVRETDTPAPDTSEPVQGSTEGPESKLPLNEKVTALADIGKLDAPSWKIEIAKAFLSKDLQKLDELCGVEAYQHLSGVEISGFEVWCAENENSTENDLFMSVTVSSVKNERATPLREGKYTFTVDAPVSGPCIVLADRTDGIGLPETETEKFITAWLGHIGYKFGDEYNTGLTQYYVEFVHSYYSAVHGGGGTKETYGEYYKTLFGVDISDMLEYYLTFENDGKAEIRYGHGGSGFYHDIAESGEDHVTVQFYADGGRLVCGPRIKYTFTRSDGILVPLVYTYEYGENIMSLGFSV